jgi:hypothetical protein
MVVRAKPHRIAERRHGRNHMKSIVITTIQAPTSSVRGMLDKARAGGFGLIVIGDRKTPAVDWPDGSRFFGIDAQKDLGFTLSTLLPENHYARKNIGYLVAMSAGATCIYDTDDDNAPLDAWQPRSQQTAARPCLEQGWINAYRWFSDIQIWPRGLPLQNAHRAAPPAPLGAAAPIDAPIQQGLANGSPDVDAAWRLLMDQEVTFKVADSVSLPSGAWCPFNSQSTWWFAAAYPLLYLPSFVSFRMTDIWRSFIAQRCLWAMGHGVVFHGAEVFQDRNPHNLLRDFEQEIPGYLGNDKFRKVLEALDLPPGGERVADNLHRCYEALVGANLIEAREMPLLGAWLNDLPRK